MELHQKNARAAQHHYDKVLQHYTNRSLAPLYDPAREAPAWKLCEKYLISEEMSKLAKDKERRRRRQKDKYLPRTLLKRKFEEKVLVTFDIQLIPSQNMLEREKALITLMECTWMIHRQAIGSGDVPDTPLVAAPYDLQMYYRFLTERRPDTNTCRRGNTLCMLKGTPPQSERLDLPTRPGLPGNESTAQTSPGNQSYAEYLQQEREKLFEYTESSNEEYLEEKQSIGEPVAEEDLHSAVSDPEDIVRNDLWHRLSSNKSILDRFRYRTLKDHRIERSPLCQVHLIDDERSLSASETEAMFHEWDRRTSRLGLSMAQVLREHRAALDVEYEAYLATAKRLQQRILLDLEEQLNADEDE